MIVKKFPNSSLYPNGYSVVFLRHVDPVESLRRVVGNTFHLVHLARHEAEVIKMIGEDIEPEDVPDLCLDDLDAADMLRTDGPLLRAGVYEDWSFIIEAEGSYIAKDEALVTLSCGTVALSARVSETTSSWIAYAEDGVTLSSFDPLFSEYDYGARPDILAERTGYREAIANGDRSESFENAFRRIQQVLGCDPPEGVDAARLLAVRIANGY
ncbi:DUF6461 domain-containing protein [Streptomyces sp. NPDC006610]|uniref:DUF6461 domain-containing protein n=1 Tax=Streptomyces sp. NPDC006610 TaxID=3154584 RepID=UPI0033A5785E